jgi:hypothetical protein
MSRLLRRVAWAVLGYIVVSLLRGQSPATAGRRRHHPLETWENEGGAMRCDLAKRVDYHPRKPPVRRLFAFSSRPVRNLRTRVCSGWSQKKTPL